MSIIQTIRDKGARISVILIALSLVGFILTDYFSSRGRSSYGGGSNIVGRINGRRLDFEDFNRKVDQSQEMMKQQGYPSTPATTQMAIDNTWEQEVVRLLLEEEFVKLGMSIGKKELGDILYGPNAPQDLKSQFTDPATGQYNAVQAKQQIDQILKKGSPEQKASFTNYINALLYQRQYEKYMALFSASYNVPRWFIEKQNADNSLMAKITMVKEAYTAIPDSVVKVEDKDVAAYVSKNKDQFQQKESRSFSYVTFSAAPSAADSADTRKRLLDLKPAMDNGDLEQLLLSEGIDPALNYSGFRNKSSIQSSVIDSIIRLPAGSVYGPYIDGNSFMLAKLQAARTIPDTIRLRHILIATSERDPQTGQLLPKRDTATAFKLADSLRNAIARGSNFDSLCLQFSEDPGSKEKGGVYENVVAGQMVPAFNDFILLNTPGSKGIVKTDFGYHYIEVLAHKGGSTGYKIAFLPKEIIPSPETDNNASNEANLFAGDSRDIKSFEENFEKKLKPKGMNKAFATVGPAEGQIMGLGYSRPLVRSIYAAKSGQVLKPEKVDDKYVVAVVTEILKEGTMSTEKARPGAEAVLRNKKKAELLRQKAGKISTLEAVATAWGGKPVETVDSLRLSGATNNALGYEPRVIGASFNQQNKGKIIPEVLEGVNAVYVIRVDNISSTPVVAGSIADQRKAQADQKKGTQNPVEGLRKAASIKDKRAEVY